MLAWNIAAPAIAAAFAASFVEAVEALTVLLAVASLRGWRPTLIGAVAALAILTLLVLIFGPLLEQVPIHVLQLTIGILLLLFGLGWLRKAVLRSAGIIPLNDEALRFERKRAQIEGEVSRNENGADWLAGIGAFKAVLLEGLEVVFIVIAVGAGGPGFLFWGAIGAAGACVAVLLLGILIHKPLSKVPENALKFGVGVMLSSFGVFWTGEGLGIAWPGKDLALAFFVVLILVYALTLAKLIGVRRAVA